MWVNDSQKRFISTNFIWLVSAGLSFGTSRNRTEQTIEDATSAKITMIHSPKKIEPLA